MLIGTLPISNTPLPKFDTHLSLNISPTLSASFPEDKEVSLKEASSSLSSQASPSSTELTSHLYQVQKIILESTSSVSLVAKWHATVSVMNSTLSLNLTSTDVQTHTRTQPEAESTQAHYPWLTVRVASLLKLARITSSCRTSLVRTPFSEDQSPSPMLIQGKPTAASSPSMQSPNNTSPSLSPPSTELTPTAVATTTEHR